MLSQTWLQFWILSSKSFLKIHKVPEVGSASVSRWNMEMEESTPLPIQKDLVLKPAWLRFSPFLFPSDDGGVSFSFGRWRMSKISVSIIHYTRIINIPYPTLDFMFQKQANQYTKLFFVHLCRALIIQMRTPWLFVLNWKIKMLAQYILFSVASWASFLLVTLLPTWF